jgi:uncharacterized membrane protein
MTSLANNTQLSVVDLIALGLTVVAWLALSWRIENPSKSRPSVTVLMSEQRRQWMRVFVTREPRIFDSQILASLRQGTSFFASTSVLAIGGVLALLGNPAPLSGVAAQVTMVQTPQIIWQMKLGVVGLFLVHSFLQFVWSNRVFGYCSVLMAAVPNDPGDPVAFPRAAQAAELNIRAALNFNRGLRSMYFALGALAWLAGPAAFMVATLAVSWTIWAREFTSLSRTIIMEEKL